LIAVRGFVTNSSTASIPPSPQADAGLPNGDTGAVFDVYLLPVRARDLLHHLYSPEDASAAVHEPISGAA